MLLHIILNMKKQNKKITLEIELKPLKEIYKNLITWLTIIAGSMIIIFLIFKCLVPLALGILEWFIMIWQMYLLLEDINFKFLGAIFFLCVGWKLFEAFFLLTEKIFVSLLEYIQERLFNK